MFTPSPIRAKLVAFSVLLLSLCPLSSASVLMLDFGPTAATEADLTNSPYHTVNDTFSDTHWNQVELANIPSGLVYSDGQAAAGVTLTLGSSVRSTLIDFSQAPSNSNALGAAGTVTGYNSVFAGTSVGKDAIYNSSSPSGINLVGVKIGGLSAGRYEVYAIGANTNNSIDAQRPSGFYIATTSDVTTFDIGEMLPSATTSLDPTNILNWSEGGSYGKMTIDLAEGEYLILATAGLGLDGETPDSRGFLNAIQIVAIPEPSVVAFCALGMLTLPLLAAMRK